jgi:hypothetical protein
VESREGWRGAMIEPLENRLLMSGVPTVDVVIDTGDVGGHVPTITYKAPAPRTWDAGDFYWYFDEQIRLYRMLDAIVVGVDKGVDPQQLNQELTGRGGVLRRFELIQILKTEERTRDVLYLETPEPLTVKKYENLLRTTERVDGVTWASAGFKTEERYKLLVTNEIFVSLAAGVNPEEFFANRFTGYRRFFDSYIGYASVGGVEALELSNQMHGMPGVNWAEPNFWMQIVLY